MAAGEPWRSLVGRVFASMEGRGGHTGLGYPEDEVTLGLSMLTHRVSMAPVAIAWARLFGGREMEVAIVWLARMASIELVPFDRRKQALAESSTLPGCRHAQQGSLAGPTKIGPGT